MSLWLQWVRRERYEAYFRRFWNEYSLYDYVRIVDGHIQLSTGYAVRVIRRKSMKMILEEFGGMILACVASLAILIMNLEMLMGPVAEKVIYIVSGNC